jgi:transcriptional regulator with XRE-family HTH domain
VNTKSSLAEQLRDKNYRDAFMASQIRIGLPMQCRALRESREMTQPQLAELIGWSQPRISELERPGVRKPNIETLLRFASAFDVALQVRFVPFSQFVDDDDSIDFDEFHVAPFPEDMAMLERREEKMKSVLVMKPSALMEEFKAPGQGREAPIKEEPFAQTLSSSAERPKARPIAKEEFSELISDLAG